MNKILAVLKAIFFSRLFLYVLGMLVAAALIWFMGPLIGIGDTSPLSTVLQRTLAITLIPAILGLGSIFSNARHQRVNTQLQQSLSETPESKAKAAKVAAGAEEVSELGGKLKEAMELLKKTKMRRTWGNGWLYEIPWYMFIGPPGSGKTTALTNCGLNFPLADEYGKKAVRGVGGTRSCDWWFTDQAVLIDTAGRYTTQDSEAIADSGAWSGFLKLLKKFRKRQPINGAIVAIGISDLLEAKEEKREEHAKAIRARLKELYTELGVPFTVYVLFTKLDRIAGFVEFFDDMTREEREQVWGMTFDPTLEKDKNKDSGAYSSYRPEFDALIKRLNDRVFERMQKETDIQRRARIFGFPQQMATLAELTDGFLRAVFQPNRYEKPARLRGVYFTSGTQQGTPIDRLMHAMATNFGISVPQASAASGSGRSYFLTNLMRDVIFGEAGLVSADSKFEKRNRLIRKGVLGSAAAAILLMTTGWTATYFNNASMVAEVEKRAASYNEQAKSVQLDRISDSDLRQIIPLLDNLRDMPGAYAQRFDSVPLLLQLGLYQGNKLGSQAVSVYRRSLNRLLLPRVLVRLEGQLKQNQDRSDFLYQALKIYLMLGQQGKLDPGLVKQWLQLDWAVQYPGPENEDTRNALSAHLEALLEKPLDTVPIDADLVERTRGVLAAEPAAERAYAAIKSDPIVAGLPPWRVSEQAGPGVSRAFVRKSGRSLADGIPGLYTHDGYFFAFRPMLPDIAERMADESWVLGASAQALSDRPAIARLQRDVTSLYLRDFAAEWDRLLADVTIVPFTSMPQQLQVLNVLSAPDSPLRMLLLNAANETWLSKAPPAGEAPKTPGFAAAAAAAAEKAAQLAARGIAARAGQGLGRGIGGGLTQVTQGLGQGQGQGQIASLLGAQNVLIEDTAGPFTDQHFKQLHDMVVGGQAGPPAIDGIVTDLNNLYLVMNRTGFTGDGAAAMADMGAAELAKLRADSARLPGSAQAIVASLTQSSQVISTGSLRAQLNSRWTASVANFCRSALDNRYPFARTSTNDVTLDDFSRLFAKDGLIDSFFNTNLRQYVDMGRNPWAWQTGATNPGIPAATLAEFQRAAAIRDRMFGGGGNTPRVAFDLVPVSKDAASTRVVVEVDGQTATYEGAPQPVRMTWPGNVGSVRVTFQPQRAGEQSTIVKDGVWAWFRLLDESDLKQSTGADRYTVTFKTGTRSATFEIRASSVVNPFGTNALQVFRCPARL